MDSTRSIVLGKVIVTQGSFDSTSLPVNNEKLLAYLKL